MATTVRINSETHSKLRELAESSGESMSVVLQKAIETYRRQRFLQKANEAFARLRRDERGWKDELDERAAWDAALDDDLGPVDGN